MCAPVAETRHAAQASRHIHEAICLSPLYYCELLKQNAACHWSQLSLVYHNAADLSISPARSGLVATAHLAARRKCPTRRHSFGKCTALDSALALVARHSNRSCNRLPDRVLLAALHLESSKPLRLVVSCSCCLLSPRPHRLPPHAPLASGCPPAANATTLAFHLCRCENTTLLPPCRIHCHLAMDSVRADGQDKHGNLAAHLQYAKRRQGWRF